MIFPKKEILYAPMLGTLGGGSMRSFGRGTGGGANPFADPFIFQNAGLDGYLGPTLSQTLAVYSSSATADQYAILSDATQFSNVNNGMQVLAIDATLAGTYRVSATSPSGVANHNGSYNGGDGAVIVADMTFLNGDSLYIIAGQRGKRSSRDGGVTSTGAGGGSGMSGAAILRGGFWYPVAIAGGGGAAGANAPGVSAQYDTVLNANRAWNGSGSSLVNRDPSGGSGGGGYRGGGGGGGVGYGTSGAGGFYGNGSDGSHGAYYPQAYGGAGGDAGHSSGGDAINPSGATVHTGSRGRSFANGGFGGGYQASIGYSNGYPPEGGYGGGGCGGLGNSAGGSGGGYSGGGGLGHSNGSDNKGGRCGTSYVSSPATLVSQASYGGSVGFVQITYTG